MISIHAPLTGSDLCDSLVNLNIHNFNPRSPHRERHSCENAYQILSEFQSTLPSQGATKIWNVIMFILRFQSTLPSQGATFSNKLKRDDFKISIHAPLTGSDRSRKRTARSSMQFQSTLPSQGATPYTVTGADLHCISIHAPLTGSDRP